MPVIREGVRFRSAIKLKIYDIVKGSGTAGIDGEALWKRVFTTQKRTNLSVHVNQINNAFEMENVDIRIRPVGRRYPHYRLVRI